MATLLSDAVPKINFAAAGMVILYVIIALIIGGMIFIAIYLWFQNKKFNKKIVLFKKVGNKVIPIGNDRAMFERVGTAGDYWCRTKTIKKTLPRPRIEMAKNEYWYYEREDGEWINFSLGDIDDQMKSAKAYYVDEDMRLQRLGIQKNLIDRFHKVTFWEKYGNFIMNIGFMIVFAFVAFGLLNQMDKTGKQLSGTYNTAGEKMEKAFNAWDNAQRNCMAYINGTASYAVQNNLQLVGNQLT